MTVLSLLFCEELVKGGNIISINISNMWPYFSILSFIIIILFQKLLFRTRQSVIMLICIHHNNRQLISVHFALMEG